MYTASSISATNTLSGSNIVTTQALSAHHHCYLLGLPECPGNATNGFVLLCRALRVHFLSLRSLRSL